MPKFNVLDLNNMNELSSYIETADLLVFGYLHSGYDALFDVFVKFGFCKNTDIFILGILIYRENDIFSLDKICHQLDNRLLIAQTAPKYADTYKRNNVNFLPLSIFQIHGYLSQVVMSKKILLFCEVGLPQKGMCNTGYSAPLATSFYKNKNCKLIGLINEKMPRTYGDTSIPAKSFLYFINLSENKLPLYPSPILTEKSIQIGKNVANLVDDEATIQIGVGTLMPAILKGLLVRSNLRMHSGILHQDIRQLVEAGVIVGKSVGNIAGAYSYDFYDWLEMNPTIEFRSLKQTHNIVLLSRVPKFTTIGSALCVDLLGQVNVETIGPTQITGIGGALDFARASELSGGKRIIAMESTYGKKENSKIVSNQINGNVISLTRNDTDYIVTEYGIAELKYKTRRERAINLIQIAHPKFRNQLRQEALRLGLINRSDFR